MTDRLGEESQKATKNWQKNVQEDLKNARITETDLKDRNAFWTKTKRVRIHSRGTAKKTREKAVRREITPVR